MTAADRIVGACRRNAGRASAAVQIMDADCAGYARSYTAKAEISRAGEAEIAAGESVLKAEAYAAVIHESGERLERIEMERARIRRRVERLKDGPTPAEPSPA